MRLPPRQSTGESDLMVPFQLVCGYKFKKSYDKELWSGQIVFVTLSLLGTHRLQQKPLRRKISIFLGYPYGQ